MPLTLFSPAPDFCLPATDDSIFTLSDYKGRSMVIFFYPKDFTPTCTREVCKFRDHYGDLTQQGIIVVGISRDKLATHKRFKRDFKLPYELLSDEYGKVAKLYKAIFPILGITRRTTYFLNETHQIIAVYNRLIEHSKHVEKMLEVVRNLK